jgi:hypothetical protein
VREHRDSIPEGLGPAGQPSHILHRRCACPSNDGDDGGVMAKKDPASKRLAEEIAFAKLLKKTPPLFTPEDLGGMLATEQLPELLWLNEDPGPVWLGQGLGRGLGEGDHWDKPILDAFKAFGLDHRSLSDWRALVSHLARVVFPKRRRPGAPRKWTDEQLCLLLADVAAYKRKRPEAPDTDICSWLKKKWPKNTPATLRRVLQEARNPKRNYKLAQMVAILERRLGPDLVALERTVEEGEVGTEAFDKEVRAKTLRWVIARADELWAS